MTVDFAARAGRNCLPARKPSILIVDKPLVCQRICPTACKSENLRTATGTGMHFYVSHRSRLTAARCFESSHRSALRLRGVPRLRSASRCPRRFSPSGLRLCTALRSVCSALQPFGPSPFRKRLHPQFAIVDPHRTQSVLVALVAHWAYFGLFHSTIHNGRLATPNGLQRFRVHWGLRTGLRFAGPVFQGCGRPLGVSSPLHPFGASTGLFRALRAASVRPVISDLSLFLSRLC